MLDRDLAADVLRVARRRGGSFAELFVEERASIQIRLDDGKVEEPRPRIRLSVHVVAARDGVIQTGFEGPAALAGVELVDRHSPTSVAEIAARRAVSMLDSVPAPA